MLRSVPLRHHPDSLALCLLDAVGGLGTNTPRAAETLLARYRAHRAAEGGDAETDSLLDLVAVFERVGGTVSFARAFGAWQRTSGRAQSPIKAQSIRSGATVLIDLGIVTTAQLRALAPGADAAVCLVWRSAMSQRSCTSWRHLREMAGAPPIPGTGSGAVAS